jgi:hypothetical protein
MAGALFGAPQARNGGFHPPYGYGHGPSFKFHGWKFFASFFQKRSVSLHLPSLTETED